MTAPIPVTSALDEEIARAEVYGLLASVFYAPPSAELLQQMRVATTDALAAGAFLEEPWRQWVGQTRNLDDQAIEREFVALFAGVGKPEVYVFGSHYISGFLNDKPLAVLRGDLAALGLTRDEHMRESEDHIAYLCEVMRFLIAGDDVAISNLERQRAFFAAHLQSWAPRLCDAIEAHPQARFYRQAAQFLRAFIEVETQAFDLLQSGPA